MMTEEEITNADRCLIAILNWQSAEETLKAIDYGDWDPSLFHIYILDNEASPDSANHFVPLMQGEHPRVHYYKSFPENLGFTGGTNVILETAIEEGYGYILFLNNDALLDKSSTDKLFDAMKNKEELGLCSPILKAGPKEAHADCGATLKSGAFLYHRHMLTPPSETLYLYGTALMARVDILKQHGGFDDRFFAYWEDFHLCKRILAAGYTCEVIKGAYAYHKNNRNDEKATKRSQYYHYYMARNGIYFWKSFGLKGWKSLYWHYSKYKKQAKLFESQKALEEAAAIKQGLWDGFFSSGGKWIGHQ